MAGWDFTNIGVSATKTTVTHMEQIMKCFGFDLEDVWGSETGCVRDEFQPTLTGNAENATISAPELFRLLNKLFGNTCVYYEHETGNNTSDYYYRDEKIFDPKEENILCGEVDYCYGDYTVFGEPADCDDLEEAGTRTFTEPLEAGEVQRKTLEQLLNVAQDKSFSELAALVEKALA